MSIEQMRAQVVASIWQAIAQSKIDLSTLPQAQQNIFVEWIVDQMLITMDSMLDEISKKSPYEILKEQSRSGSSIRTTAQNLDRSKKTTRYTIPRVYVTAL